MIYNLSVVGRKMVTIVDPHIRRDDEYYIYKQALDGHHFVLDKDAAVYEGWCWPGSEIYSYLNVFTYFIFKPHRTRIAINDPFVFQFVCHAGWCDCCANTAERIEVLLGVETLGT